MSKPAEKIQIQLPVTLTQEAYNALISAANSPTPMVSMSSWAGWLLAMYAGGGMMLQPSHLQTIAANTGASPKTPEEVVKACLKSAAMQDGQHTFTVQVDPSLWAPLEELARWRNATVQEVLTTAANQMLQNGWIESLVPEHRVDLVEADHKMLSDWLGTKAFTGRQLVEWLQSLKSDAKVAA